MTAVQIEARFVGRRKPVVPPWQMPIPEEWQIGDNALTLRDLILRVVAHEVAAYNQRQEQNQFLNVLTNRQTGEQAQSGAVRFGGREPQMADLNEAIQAAIEFCIRQAQITTRKLLIKEERHSDSKEAGFDSV
jgi:hypothetical protein